jgi:hypothetical protein
MTYRKPVGPRGLGNIRRASAIWGRGETVLAEIHLARSGLPRLPDEDAPFRLFAAERILTAGITPRDLLKACGLDSSPLDLVKAGYDPDEPRVPAGDPDGGQWTTGGAEPKTPAAPREQLEPVNFTPVHRLPNDAVVVTPPDGKPVADPDSPTKKLMAPPHADFRQVYAAGRSIAGLSYSEQYRRARAAIAQGGTFDFQRDVSQQKFYHPYVHAANYAVGVYMAGAGYSLPVTLALAKLYAFGNSSNYDVQDREDWIRRGWNDANSGRWR